MRYVVDSLPGISLDCPFCEPSLEQDGFLCNATGQFSCECNLFGESVHAHDVGECNGLIEFETLSNNSGK